MQISVPAETTPNERRVALIPDTTKKLVRVGFEVVVQSGLGEQAGFSDDTYSEAGATVSDDRAALLGDGDIVLRVRKPDTSEVSQLKEGAIHVSYLDPYNERDLVDTMAKQGVSAISLSLIHI